MYASLLGPAIAERAESLDASSDYVTSLLSSSWVYSKKCCLLAKKMLDKTSRLWYYVNWSIVVPTSTLLPAYQLKSLPYQGRFTPKIYVQDSGVVPGMNDRCSRKLVGVYRKIGPQNFWRAFCVYGNKFRGRIAGVTRNQLRPHRKDFLSVLRAFVFLGAWRHLMLDGTSNNSPIKRAHHELATRTLHSRGILH